MNREELFDKHLRGELSSAESVELKRLLATDADAGRVFVEHANETALLVRVGSQLRSARVPNNVVPLVSLEEQALPASASPNGRQKSGARDSRPSSIVKWAALAACFLALAVVAISLMRNSPPRRVAEVYVTGASVQVTRDGELMDDAVELQAGDVIAAPGNDTAVIVYEREATRLELQPGSVVIFGDAARGKSFELRRGILQARVAPQPTGQPMVVKTAHARATVLGTEFVMRADERTTKLDVLEGNVEFACRASGKKMMVKAGFAATLNRKAPFSVAPLCSSNCILRECRSTNVTPDSQNSKRTNEK